MYYGFTMYTNLKTGQDYSECKPSYHIGFVKKSPFADDEQFYSNFILMEEKTHRVYSGDFRISMINLSHVENATEEDRQSGLYDWTRLFLATEWEELVKMAQQSEVLGRAIVTLAELSEEEQIRQQCEARRKYEMDEQATARKFKRLNDELEKKNIEIQKQTDQIQMQTTQLKEKDVQLEEAALRDRLTGFLVRDKRYGELERALRDETFRNELLTEYKLIDKK